MNNKAIISGILLVSTILVMYPMISTYLDLEEAYSGWRNIPIEVQNTMLNMRLQIIGFSLLFATLFLILYHVKLKDGISSKSTTEQPTLPSTPQKPTKPEEQDWYQEAMKQHQINITEESESSESENE